MQSTAGDCKHLEKLRTAGAIGIVRAVRIIATPASSQRRDLAPNQRLVHLQRHGQGFHNLLSDYVKQLRHDNDPDGATQRDVMHPYRLEEMIDPPLTEKGRTQCKERQPDAVSLTPAVVLVSPLSRAIQTALITFKHLHGRVPFIAVEALRETIGVNTCDKRRAQADLAFEFGHLVDLSRLREQDELWTHEHRESPLELVDRIYCFLLEIREQEQEVAIVGHSGWLLAMLAAVCDCSSNPSLAAWFETCEIRSVVLTFEDHKTMQNRPLAIDD